MSGRESRGVRPPLSPVQDSQQYDASVPYNDQRKSHRLRYQPFGGISPSGTLRISRMGNPGPTTYNLSGRNRQDNFERGNTCNNEHVHTHIHADVLHTCRTQASQRSTRSCSAPARAPETCNQPMIMIKQMHSETQCTNQYWPCNPSKLSCPTQIFKNFIFELPACPTAIFGIKTNTINLKATVCLEALQ